MISASAHPDQKNEKSAQIKINIFTNRIAQIKSYKDWIKITLLLKRDKGFKGDEPDVEDNYNKLMDNVYYRCLSGFSPSDPVCNHRGGGGIGPVRHPSLTTQ
jgi:hypothetical protein